MSKRRGNGLKPYIGVTGITSAKQADELLAVMPENPPRLLMIGVLVSLKTLLREDSPQPGRYPRIQQVGGIFSPHPSALNMIHYATHDTSTLGNQLKLLMEDVQRYGMRAEFPGLQLNMYWPEDRALRHWKEGTRLVLQIGQESLNAVDRDPQKLVEMLRAYEGRVTDILLDPSEGRGRPLDTAFMHRALELIYRHCPTLMVGVAGGLAPETVVHLVGRLARDFPLLSVDAEGALRTPSDELNMERAKAYVEKGVWLHS